MSIMTDDSTYTRGRLLPVEIVLRIIDSLAPDTDVALHPRDSTARTIKAFTLVSRATYTTALRLLYTHCLYVDSSSRLRRLLVCLCDHHLSPARPLTNTLPPVDVVACLQNLYLAPFPKTSLDDLPTASWVFELFTITRHTLRRLIVNIPFRSLPQWQDHLNVRPKLRAAFTELTAIEEFTSVNDDLYLSAHYGQPLHPLIQLVQPDTTPIWSRWRSLRRLSLHGANLAHHDYRHLVALPNLETLVVVRPDADNRQAWSTLFNRLPLARYQQQQQQQADQTRKIHVIWPEVDCGDAMNARLTTTPSRLLHNASYHMNRCRWAHAWNARPLPPAPTTAENPALLDHDSSDTEPLSIDIDIDIEEPVNGGAPSSFDATYLLPDTDIGTLVPPPPPSKNRTFEETDSHGPRGLRFSALTIDPEYIPGTGWDHSDSVKTWVRDRALQGRLWDVDREFHRGIYHPDHWHQVCEGERGRPWLED